MKTSIVFALGLAFALPVYAQDKPAEGAGQDQPKSTPEKVFTKKDKDGDKFLSKEEFTAGAKDAAKAATVFTKKDKDADGKLTLAEFSGKGGAKRGAKKAGAEEPKKPATEEPKKAE